MISNVYRYICILGVLALFINSCGESDKDDSKAKEGEESQNSGTLAIEIDGVAVTNESLSLDGVDIPQVEPPVKEVTPGALAINSTTPLRLDDGLNLNSSGNTFTLNCSKEAEVCPGGDGYAQDICYFLNDLKCRFLGTESGPSTIPGILNEVDNNSATFKQRTKDSYVGCLDPNNDENFADNLRKALIGAGRTSGDVLEKLAELDPYELTEYNPTYTFFRYDFDENTPTGESYDFSLPFPIKAGCADVYDETENKFRTYAKEAADANGVSKTHILEHSYNGFAATVSSEEGKQDRVEIFRTVGSKDYTDYKQVNTSDNEKVGTNLIYHLKADPNNSTLEMTMAGVGAGPGCGMHFISDGEHLYGWWDPGIITKDGENADSTCVNTPTIENASTAENPGNGPVLREVCVDLVTSGEITQVDMSTCENKDLNSSAFTMPTYTLNANNINSDKFDGFPGLEAYSASEIFGGDKIDKDLMTPLVMINFGNFDFGSEK